MVRIFVAAGQSSFVPISTPICQPNCRGVEGILPQLAASNGVNRFCQGRCLKRVALLTLTGGTVSDDASAMAVGASKHGEPISTQPACQSHPAPSGLGEGATHPNGSKADDAPRGSGRKRDTAILLAPSLAPVAPRPFA